MLLSVRQNFPQPGKKLHPRLFGQRGGDVAELDEGAEQGFHLQRKRLVKPGTGRPEILPLGASHAPAQEARLPRTWPASKDLKKAHASDRQLLRRRMPRCAESCAQSRRGLGSDGPPRLNPREYVSAY